MLKRFCAGTSPLELVEEREALFYLLPQTTPERLAKNLTGYTIDPKTRYPNLGKQNYILSCGIHEWELATSNVLCVHYNIIVLIEPSKRLYSVKANCCTV